MLHRPSNSRISSCLAVLLLLGLAGCNIFGPVFGIGAHALPHHVSAQYKGLKGQTVAIMVWTDRGIRADNPYLAIDLASGIQRKLVELMDKDHPPELEKTRFNVDPATVVHYQEDHPEMDTMPIVQTAGKFNNITRLIYLEVDDFSTRAEASLSLYRGTIGGNLKVLEIKDGAAKIGYEDPRLEVVYPKNDPKEGMPDGNDVKIYNGTLDAFSTKIVQQFYEHDADD